MDFNFLIFPAPESSYTCEEFKGKLIWIPQKQIYKYKDKMKYNKSHSSNSSKNLAYTNRLNSSTSIQKIPNINFSFDNKFQDKSKTVEIKKKQNDDEDGHIPCIFIKRTTSNIVGIYFHANYEDCGQSYEMCSLIAEKLNINILLVEYPNYGVYKTRDVCNSEKILKDAERVYVFLNEILGIEEKYLLLLGRSIGTGPAIHLASKFNPTGLFLISPFTSLKSVVGSIFDQVKLGWMFKAFVSERFENSKLIAKVSCPVLFIHGKKDEIIPWQQSLELIKNCKCPAKLSTPENMKHNVFNINLDIVKNMKDFIQDIMDEDFLHDTDSEIIDFSDYYEFDDIDSDDEIRVGYFPSFMFKKPVH